MVSRCSISTQILVKYQARATFHMELFDKFLCVVFSRLYFDSTNYRSDYKHTLTHTVFVLSFVKQSASPVGPKLLNSSNSNFLNGSQRKRREMFRHLFTNNFDAWLHTFHSNCRLCSRENWNEPFVCVFVVKSLRDCVACSRVAVLLVVFSQSNLCTSGFFPQICLCFFTFLVGLWVCVVGNELNWFERKKIIILHKCRDIFSLVSV